MTVFIMFWKKNRRCKVFTEANKHTFIFVTHDSNNFYFLWGVIILWKSQKHCLLKIWSITWPFENETLNDICTWKIIILVWTVVLVWPGVVLTMILNQWAPNCLLRRVWLIYFGHSQVFGALVASGFFWLRTIPP